MSQPINVAIIGSGGREHALAWRMSQSPTLGRLFALPGNPGIARIAQCANVQVSDHAAVARFCHEHEVGLVVVGPEDPLAAGITDDLTKAGLAVFGPKRAAARLEAEGAPTDDETSESTQRDDDANTEAASLVHTIEEERPVNSGTDEPEHPSDPAPNTAPESADPSGTGERVDR